MTTVTFDFHGDDGPVQQVTVPDCSAELLASLRDAEAGKDGNDTFQISNCHPAGASVGTWLFRASRIRNVQEAS
jgi:hypothetical protein